MMVAYPALSIWTTSRKCTLLLLVAFFKTHASYSRYDHGTTTAAVYCGIASSIYTEQEPEVEWQRERSFLWNMLHFAL